MSTKTNPSNDHRLILDHQRIDSGLFPGSVFSWDFYHFLEDDSLSCQSSQGEGGGVEAPGAVCGTYFCCPIPTNRERRYRLKSSGFCAFALGFSLGDVVFWTVGGYYTANKDLFSRHSRSPVVVVFRNQRAGSLRAGKYRQTHALLRSRIRRRHSANRATC